MQIRRVVQAGGLAGVLLLAGALLSVMLWYYPQWLGLRDDGDRQAQALKVVPVITGLIVLVLGAFTWLGRQIGRAADTGNDSAQPRPVVSPEPGAEVVQRAAILRNHLRDHYGLFWRRKVRLLWVVGEAEQVDAIAPGLTEQRWLEGDGTVLLWGGSGQEALTNDSLETLQRLCRWRPLDAILWTLTTPQSHDPKAMAAGSRYLRDLSQALGWQLPLYLWEVCPQAWIKPFEPAQPVGCLLAPDDDLGAALQQLIEPLNQRGMAHIQVHRTHCFLFYLGHHLHTHGAAHWPQALAPLLPEFARSTPLRGLHFSLARTDGPVPGTEHLLQLDGAWAALLADRKTRPRRRGWHARRMLYVATLAATGVLTAGVLLSFVANRNQALHLAQVAEQPITTLTTLSNLTREVDRLEYRRVHGEPWYLGFGLSHSQALLDSLWPRYVQATHALLRDKAVASLEQTLWTLVAQPAGSKARTAMAGGAYEPLKAYLMLAHPEKADPAFLEKLLLARVPDLPGQWSFYLQQLPSHPEWRIDANPRLIAQVRQVLLGELGQHNAEASLYQQVLDRAGNHFPSMALAQMLGDTQASALFGATRSVPGIFTRQAWDGQIRAAIDDIAEARRAKIDWVLTDKAANVDSELSPATLKARLTARYFKDFGSAWLSFLNSVRWRQAKDLGEAVDQLALISDPQQSPLMALITTVAYQAGTGGKTLINTAQQTIDTPMPQGPLDATFAPLLQLLAKDNSPLSLHSYLTRVTRVRLQLQQIDDASDPQAMTQALAQSVFQGRTLDLGDSREYGSLIAASLGGQWSGFGQNLFVKPLAQAWQQVLQPSAAALNAQWQRAIVEHWDGAFSGRYPFAATGSDASLPMLGQMIRAGTGRIDQFLQQELGGVLRKEGNRCVVDPRHSQGLRVNPAFLAAVNRLGHLADVLYTDGGMGLGFELQAKALPELVQTTFILNGERLHYFNQKPSWKRFHWPGASDYPGASLSWTSVATGERLFGAYDGAWGLIRLLEQAQVTALDDSDTRFRLVLKAPDGIPLTWHLRTELGAGPLALLTLRGFSLPPRIFLAEGDAVGPQG
ncbi:ImcF-related family protein [Pseudomonas sp. App30]|uniref:ImcF-related family protein n=1 Tax=Pseudomonas sp. App30 TaxID=3068990 RepID=UPI003A7F9F88